MADSIILSNDELTWLQASLILDSPPVRFCPEKFLQISYLFLQDGSQNIFIPDISISSSLSTNYFPSSLPLPRNVPVRFILYQTQRKI